MRANFSDILLCYYVLYATMKMDFLTKNVLESRPIYLSTYEHINAHFVICFISLLIGRIVEMRFDGEYSIAKITCIPSARLLRL